MSVFSNPSLYIWKFLVHVLWKPSLKDFVHYLASTWNEHNCMVVWAFLASPFFGLGVNTDLFQSVGHCCFPVCWQYWVSTFTAPSLPWVGAVCLPVLLAWFLLLPSSRLLDSLLADFNTSHLKRSVGCSPFVWGRSPWEGGRTASQSDFHRVVQLMRTELESWFELWTRCLILGILFHFLNSSFFYVKWK